MGLRERVIEALCDLVAWSWIAAWCGVLYLVASPWSELGGLVSERLRWLEWFVLYSGLIVGFTAAGIYREVVRDDDPSACVRGMRRLVYPAGIAAAAGMVVLAALGRNDPIGIVLTGLIVYCIGVWVRYRDFVRRMRERSLRVVRPQLESGFDKIQWRS